MAKKQVQGSAWGRAFQFRGFVNCALTEAHKRAFKERTWEVEDIWSVLADVVADYKLSITTDQNNDAIVASFTCMNPSNPAHGYILSARAGGVFDALCVLLFKHLYVLAGKWDKALEAHSTYRDGDIG